MKTLEGTNPSARGAPHIFATYIKDRRKVDSDLGRLIVTMVEPAESLLGEDSTQATERILPSGVPFQSEMRAVLMRR